MNQTPDTELRRMRLLLGDAAAELDKLQMTTVTLVRLLQMIAQAEKCAERAVKLAQSVPATRLEYRMRDLAFGLVSLRDGRVCAYRENDCLEAGSLAELLGGEAV